LLTSKEIRQSFLEFFKEKEHTIVPSSSVVPYDDPTLLFANAGMNQFKDVFLGTGTRDYSRCADTQKCIRAGGKHNDLEEVGMDGYHHTFFEMLGNWSFGDYYKKEVIKWAWELLTEVWKLPKERLWATVYNTDDEAFKLWKSETDIDPSHILRFDEKDNFWEMGETGPCGPCSEIHYDFTPDGCKVEDINADLEDVIEIWNLVFIQYNKDDKGELSILPKKNVDTGLGFERVVRVLQGKNSNYETDVFQPIINRLCEITGKKYKGENVSSLNAIADHIRTLTFAISDGAVPSNEGRGYVLRRILRRAARLSRKLNYKKPLLYKLVGIVVNNFGEIFPELVENKNFVIEVIRTEEESFSVTLDRGIELFYVVILKLEKKKTKIFPGEDAFKLYDTYGFPLDLTQVMAKEHGYTVDLNKFDEEMGKQKDRARKDRKEHFAYSDSKDFEFDEKDIGENSVYNPWEIEGKEIETKIVKQFKLKNPSENILVLTRNPFYSEAGGQISDVGKIVTNNGTELDVIDVPNKYSVLVRTKNKTDIPELDKSVTAKVDYRRRRSIQRNHTATHILHEALRQILGNHVKQMGSLVSDEYLRFDFPHFQKVETKQLKEIEDIVNKKIQENITLKTLKDISIEEANKIPNVKKFFGEKYEDKVRVVIVDDKFSIEFCGGTHVSSTNDIGLFKIVKEESISSGVRRIFAITGEGIIKYINERVTEIEKLISELPEKYSNNFKTSIDNFKKDFEGADFRDVELMKKLIDYQDSTIASLYRVRENYLEEKKQTKKQLLKQNLKKVFKQLDNIITESSHHADITIVSTKMDLQSMEELNEVGEELRKKLKNGVGLIAIVLNNKIYLVCAVSDNLIKENNLNAGKLISDVAKELGGGGGGRPQLATAGGKDISKLSEVLDKFPAKIKNILKQ